MSDNRVTMNIQIDNLTDAQAIALEDLLAKWQQSGRLGCSRWTSFYADGDGNFHPRIAVDGHPPEHQKVVDPDKHWTLGAPWKGDYKIDFDGIAWALRAQREKS